MRTKTSENGVVQQRLSLSDVGLKYLATTVTHGKAADESEFVTAKTSVWWDVENCQGYHGDISTGVKDGSDKKILVDMLLWAMQNRAPSNLMLISGDGDYSYVLHRLRMLGYNVLLVRPENVSCFLIAAVNTIWLWRSIVAGGSGAEIPKQATRKRMKSDLVVKSKSRKRLCETCNVTCISVVDYNSHLSSKKHKKKVKLCLFSGLLELT
ncbi:unnamed protein product [Brassica oleracea]|uniref:(rape) hypothetical protein n=1 Tax=Brassica napus TaxID=3708 RepID=A0A816K8Z2_BRANA|nr:unnamed protein product [Brassica napus]